MPQPVVLMVMGSPGVGKSTVARRFSSTFRLPVFSRDTLKESLFDTLGWTDREWSRKLGISSYRLLEIVLENMLVAEKSCIVESNFRPEFDAPWFRRLQERFGCQIVQILCEADPAVIIARFRERVLRGDRHPGHSDLENLEEFERMIYSWNGEPLDVPSQVARLRLQDFTAVDYGPVEEMITNALTHSTL